MEKWKIENGTLRLQTPGDTLSKWDLQVASRDLDVASTGSTSLLKLQDDHTNVKQLIADAVVTSKLFIHKQSVDMDITIPSGYSAVAADLVVEVGITITVNGSLVVL